MCERESSWEPWTIRYEPDFYALYIVPLNLPDATEARARAFSWGLLQIMGQVVREVGYTGPLAALCDPATALEWGCKVFAGKLLKADGAIAKALYLWNGGGNPDYPDEVMDLAAKYE
jgi:soluble lytic murein transglycosylase-like protein